MASEFNDQLLDLVHPSLNCCVFGMSKCLPSSTEVATAAATATTKMLPLDAVERIQRTMFTGKRRSAMRTALVHEQSPPNPAWRLYDPLACIFQAVVRLFDNVLPCLLTKQGPLPALHFVTFGHEVDTVPVRPPVPERLEIDLLDCPPFTLQERNVQVIAIAEIHLTPDKPSYAGGVWHVKRSDAEQTVATGSYYFGCDNITESRLAFRVIVQEPAYQQQDQVGIMAAHGLALEKRLVQSLGAVTALKDRGIVFPNTLEHRDEPFELADPARPGVRKILAFFRVDLFKIPFTSVSPPRQAAWRRASWSLRWTTSRRRGRRQKAYRVRRQAPPTRAHGRAQISGQRRLCRQQRAHFLIV